jgi:beta-lactamase regulating signal transducer with metallopeptidase domain
MNRLMIASGALFTGLLPLLIDSAAKAAGLLLVAAISVLILRKASAASRHLVWLCALGALLVLPILSALLPRWAVLPRVNTAGEKSAPPFNPDKPFQTHLDQAAAIAVKSPAASGVVSAMPMASKGSFHGFDWLPLVWALGFALLVIRVAAAQWFLTRAGKRCILVRDGRLAEAKQKACHQLNVRQPVQLLLDPRRTIPMAWGVFRPRVLLPMEAADWDETRLRAVLLHEMAHIKRADAVVRWLVQLCCAVHWFNPLVWFAAWRLRVESERACDDLVVVNGVRPSDYAKHLLHVATTLSPARLTQACGMAMASPSGLEGRLLAVLDQKANRRRVPRAWVFAALTLGFCVVVPVAMLRAASDKALSDAVVEGRTDNQRTNEDHSIPAGAATQWDLGTDNEQLPPYKFGGSSKADGFNLNVVPIGIEKPLDEAQWAAGYRVDLRAGPDANTLGTATSTVTPPPTQSTDAGNNGVNRMKRDQAKLELQRATALRKQNLISETDFNEAKSKWEIADAELAGRPDVVARIRLRGAETELARLEQLHNASLVSEHEVDQAKYRVALLRAEMNGDSTEAARVRLREAEDELKRASQLRERNLVPETDYNNARQQVELRRAELRQADTERPATTSSTDETQKRLRAIDEARAKAEAVKLKWREAGQSDRMEVFNAARAERDKQLVTARNSSEQLKAYERYAEEAADRERELLKAVEVGAQPPGMADLAHYETLLAEFELAQAKTKATSAARPPVGQILVEARVIEAPPNVEIPDDPSKVTSGKGINVLSSPRVVTGIGEEAEIFVGKEQPANAALDPTDYLRTGITMRVKPDVKDGRIAYTVRLTMSDLVHSEANDTQTINETSSGDLHVSGTAKDGEGTWFHLHQYRSDRKVSVISVWLRFKRVS